MTTMPAYAVPLTIEVLLLSIDFFDLAHSYHDIFLEGLVIDIMEYFYK